MPPKDSFKDLMDALIAGGGTSTHLDQVWFLTKKNHSYRASCVEGGGQDWNLYGPIEMIQFRLHRLGCVRDAGFKEEPDRGPLVERKLQRWVKLWPMCQKCGCRHALDQHCPSPDEAAARRAEDQRSFRGSRREG